MIAVGKNGNLATLVGEDARELFNYRGLACTTHGEVTYGDDLHAEGMITIIRASYSQRLPLTMMRNTWKGQRVPRAVRPFCPGAHRR